MERLEMEAATATKETDEDGKAKIVTVTAHRNRIAAKWRPIHTSIRKVASAAIGESSVHLDDITKAILDVAKENNLGESGTNTLRKQVWELVGGGLTESVRKTDRAGGRRACGRAYTSVRHAAIRGSGRGSIRCGER
jgi:hypothetical protein